MATHDRKTEKAGYCPNYCCPFQDISELEEKDCMKFLSTEISNWLWRLTKKHFKKDIIKQLHGWTKLYNRLAPERDI